jgi:hypothetical protein
MENSAVIYTDGSVKINGENYGHVHKHCGPEHMAFNYRTSKGKDVILKNAVYVYEKFTYVVNHIAIDEILEIESEI